MKHFRTEIRRLTVTQEIQEILAEPLKPGVCRKVQILAPQSPTIFIAIDVPEEDVGTNKTFNLPIYHPGQFVEFPLGGDQKLYGACAVGFAVITLILEYSQEDAR